MNFTPVKFQLQLGSSSVKEIPPPAPLVFTPSKGLPKIQDEVEIKTAKTIEEVAEEDSDWETIDDCESEVLENVQVAEEESDCETIDDCEQGG